MGHPTPDSSANPLSASTISPPGEASPARPKPMTSPESGDNYKSQALSSSSGRRSAQLERDGRRSTSHTPAPPAPSPHRTSRNLLPSPTSPSVPHPRADSSALPRYSAGPSSPAILVPAEPPEAGPEAALSYLQRETPVEGGSTFLSPDAITLIERRRSYDDGTRPLNILFKNDAPPSGLSQSVRLSGSAGKRNSINPAMSFNYEALAMELNDKPSSVSHSLLSTVPPRPTWPTPYLRKSKPPRVSRGGHLEKCIRNPLLLPLLWQVPGLAARLAGGSPRPSLLPVLIPSAHLHVRIWFSNVSHRGRTAWVQLLMT
ncbi:hypothetical protein B0F90DRAFT_1087565 [Multifurca ochricompacta]|uniref:Uncharacterized protein n=1 Tax=Multifurca ochricompacta TaxID=376703 RepID=A0AAD4M8Y0_9AGAM|nr:hypothetical protein B0F90DRAFT_1087565 [Multifurca ochricompacta]